MRKLVLLLTAALALTACTAAPEVSSPAEAAPPAETAAIGEAAAAFPVGTLQMAIPEVMPRLRYRSRGLRPSRS